MHLSEATNETLEPVYVVTGATLISMDDQLPRQINDATFWVEGGTFGGVLGPGQPLPERFARAQRIDVGGRVVVPGLTDGHAHLDRETLGDDLPGFSDAQTLEEMLDALADVVRETPAGDWIVTQPLGLPPNFPNAETPFTDGRLPTRHDLDRVSPKNPVFIRPIWGYWNFPAKQRSFANSLALQLNGVNRSTVSPHPDLEIVRDEYGDPTGQFIEIQQQPLIEHTLMRQAPGFTRNQRAEAMRRGFVRYARYGTTATYEGHGIADEVLEAYLDALESGLSLRVTLPLSPYWPSIDSLPSTLHSWDARFATRERGQMAGIYVDVANEFSAHDLRSADHPRTGWAGFTSAAVLRESALEQWLLVCATAGIRVSGITASLLPLMHNVHRRVPIHGLKWTLGHQATLSPTQIEQVADMGLVLTTITGHNIERGVYTRDLVGTQRESEIVPLKSLCDAGVPVVLGSDNRPITLWESVRHAVTRVDSLGRIVTPEERLDPYDALRLITVNGAVLTGDEGRRGIIAPGYLADFAVLDRNPLTCDPETLHETQSLATFVGGRPIFERDLEKSWKAYRPTA